jgi:acyl-CoA thioester hydrolase
MNRPTRDDYRYFQPIQTRWMDNDVYGHVNNAVYYAYFDTIINRWLIDQGGLDPHAGDVIGLCVESRCSYLAPAKYPDDLEAGMRTLHLGRSSVRYGVGIFHKDELIAHGDFVHVFVERAARTSTPIPPTIRAALEKLA